METLGVLLRQTREARGSTLKQVEIATRIKSRFLEMLEAGNFAALPGGEMQARGFLRIYARYLELPADEVLARYEIEVHGGEVIAPAGGAAYAETRPPSPAPPAASAGPPRQGFSVFNAHRRGGTVQTLFIAGATVVALVVVAVVVWFLAGRGEGERATAASTTMEAPEATQASVLIETVTPAVATPTLAPDATGGVTLELEATEHVWVCVKADSQTVFEGLMAPEQVQTWSGQELVVVETGNGAGLLVTVNGQPQGQVGLRGRIQSRAWGPGGEVEVPSPTPVPTS